MAKEILYKAGDNADGVVASEDIPKVMRAVLALGVDKETKEPLGYEFVEIQPTPEIKPDEVLIKVEYSGMCHTDTMCLDGRLVRKGPRIPGHEFAGKIVAMGQEVVVSYSKVTPLDGKALVRALYNDCAKTKSLGEYCPACRQEQYNLCDDAIFTGVMVDGGFADYFKISPKELIMLPEDVATKQAFTAGDALITAKHGVDEAFKKIRDYSSVIIGVIGAVGGLGIAAINMLLAEGRIEPDQIIAVDTRKEPLEKLGDEMGVKTVHSDGLPITQRMINTAGRRIDAVIDCVGLGGDLKKAYQVIEESAQKGIGDGVGQLNYASFRIAMVTYLGKGGTIGEALSQDTRIMEGYVRKGGSIVVIGSNKGYMFYPVGNFMASEISPWGPWGGKKDEAQHIIKLLKEKQIPEKGLELLLGKERAFTADEFKAAVKDVKEHNIMGRTYFNMQK